MYRWLVLKRKIESFLLFPFVFTGRLLGQFGKNEDFEIYFFFPFYHIGGAEKVHYQIAQSFIDKKCVIYFTRKSRGQGFRHEFEKTGFPMRDISRYTDNKFLYFLNFLYRGIISAKINRQTSRAVVFNGQSNFGYKLSPWVKKAVPQIDLIHALCSFSTIRIPFLGFYSKSVTVSREIVQKHRELYNPFRIPAAVLNKFCYVNYGIELPAAEPKAVNPQTLSVLYVGRGSEEKRVYLIAQLAAAFSEIDKNVRFNFLGDVENFIPDHLKKFCHFYGSITDPDEVDRIYRMNDVVMVTSYTESGPLVVMEGMARGLSIVSTPVGIVNEHVASGKNGFVFSSVESEETIVSEGTQFLFALKNDPDRRRAFSEANLRYAVEHFGIEHFRKNYRALFHSLNPEL